MSYSWWISENKYSNLPRGLHRYCNQRKDSIAVTVHCDDIVHLLHWKLKKINYYNFFNCFPYINIKYKVYKWIIITYQLQKNTYINKKKVGINFIF